MPAENAALNAYFEAKEKEDARMNKRKRPIDTRRVELKTCSVFTDPKKSGLPRFKNDVCCKRRGCTGKYTPEDVLTLRKSLIDRPRCSVDRRAFLGNRYQPRATHQQRGGGRFMCDSPVACRLGSIVAGTALPLHPQDSLEVCANFFHWAYSVSTDQMVKSLSSRYEYSKRRMVKESPKQWVIEEWLVDLSKYYQLQPDSNLVLLPFANRTSVYEMYVLDEVKHVHSSYFFLTWRTSPKSSHIRLRKHLRFTKCDCCVDLRERKSRTMDRKLLDEIRKLEYAHYQFVKEERGGYYLRRRYSCLHPEDALSIIIDGADWYNYALPYFATKTHASSKLYRAPIYLMGLIAHGRGTKCYVIPGHFKQGTNVVLDVLIRYLKQMKAKGQNIPKKIYLQLDNTCKQNKNRYLLGILGYLVYLKVADKILVSFLPKGHTHEDIDQLFSRLVIALLCRDARSIQELMAIIRSAYKDKHGRQTETEEVFAPANLSEWIDPYLHSFTGLTKFRQFMLKWCPDNEKVIVRVRSDTTNAAWRGIEEKTDFTEIFKTFPPRVIPALPACQRRDPPGEEEQKHYVSGLAKVMSDGLRGMSADHKADFKRRVDLVLDDTPIQCDWDDLDLGLLGVRNADAKAVVRGQIMEEEEEASNIYNISDYVLIAADQTITPDQRFWVAQVMNTACCPHMPDIDIEDPPSQDHAQRWLKVWWSESESEYGRYRRGYHTNGGRRVRSMSWEAETNVICKVIGGLNSNGTLKAYKNYRKQMEYDVKAACGELLGDEELEYERKSDGVSLAVAKTFLGRRVKSLEDGDVTVGMVTELVLPEDDDSDRRIHFRLRYDDAGDSIVPHADLLTLILS